MAEEKPFREQMLRKYYENYFLLKDNSKPVPTPIKLSAYVEWGTSQNIKQTSIGRIWAKHVDNASSVLDYGGGQGRLEKALRNLGYSGSYETMDYNTSINHDFNNIQDIEKQYDLVTCLEVIEHLYFKDFLDLMPRIASLVKPGGWLAVSTPNPAHPNHLYNIDMGHIKAYPFKDLHRYLQTLGFEANNSEVVLIYSINKDTTKYRMKYRLRRFMLSLLDSDCHHNYIIFIQKKW